MLNVKDPEAHRLAKAISDRTGENMTKVVVGALREKLARIEQGQARPAQEDLLLIARRAAAAIQHRKPLRAGVDAFDELYGDGGAPR
jgi:antitoxin VapB